MYEINQTASLKEMTSGRSGGVWLLAIDYFYGGRSENVSWPSVYSTQDLSAL